MTDKERIEQLVEALKYIRTDLENNGEILRTDEARIEFLTEMIEVKE